MSDACVLVVGGCYVDEIHTVERFPHEDGSVRSADEPPILRRGGNAATTAVVLAQLLPTTIKPRWIGALPPKTNDSRVDIALDDFRKHAVDASLREEVQTGGMPSAIIIKSRSTGSRTIISSRRGMRELDVNHHFRAHLPRISAPSWAHLEGRHFESVMEMTSILRDCEQSRLWRISVEIESPTRVNVDQATRMSSTANVVFVASDWVRHHGGAFLSNLDEQLNNPDSLVPAFLEALHNRAEESFGFVEREGGCWYICAWGAVGAYALVVYGLGASRTLQRMFEPAPRVRVVDSTGAGDSFIGACIAAFCEPGFTTSRILEAGCAVASAKVAQEGFDGLQAAFPPSRTPRTSDGARGAGEQANLDDDCLVLSA